MRKSYPEKMRKYRNSIQNLHRILPKSIRNRPQIDENTFLERFRRQVATKSARGWFPQTAGVPLLAPGWSKTVLRGSILRPRGSQNSVKIALLSTGWHLDPRQIVSGRRFGKTLSFYEKSMRKSKAFDGSEPCLALYSSLISHIRNF